MNKKQGIILAVGLVIISLIIMNIALAPSPKKGVQMGNITLHISRESTPKVEEITISPPQAMSIFDKAMSFAGQPLATKTLAIEGGNFAPGEEVDIYATVDVHWTSTGVEKMKNITFTQNGFTSGSNPLLRENAKETDITLVDSTIQLNSVKTDWGPSTKYFSRYAYEDFTGTLGTPQELTASELDGGTMHLEVVVTGYKYTGETITARDSVTADVSINIVQNTLTVTIDDYGGTVSP